MHVHCHLDFICVAKAHVNENKVGMIETKLRKLNTSLSIISFGYYFFKLQDALSLKSGIHIEQSQKLFSPIATVRSSPAAVIFVCIYTYGSVDRVGRNQTHEKALLHDRIISLRCLDWHTVLCYTWHICEFALIQKLCYTSKPKYVQVYQPA